jgi:flagellar biogenesis protein FliO
MEVMAQAAAACAVLALLGGALWWLRARGYAIPASSRRGGRRLESVERVSLGPQQMLHLVKLGDRALLVATSAAGCRLLKTCDWRETSPPEEARR